MRRATKWRPWQFSLRFLLAVTTVVAVGAAFFGWRERQMEPQRRAVARIVELGGSVEVERRGWFEAITRGCDTEEVVGVTLPGHLVDEVVPELQALCGLRRVTMAYSRFSFVEMMCGMAPLSSQKRFFEFLVDDQFIDPDDESPRFTRLKEQLPQVEVDVSHNGAIVPTDRAFVGSETFHNVFR